MKSNLIIIPVFLLSWICGFSQPNPEKMIDSLISIGSSHISNPDSLAFYAQKIYLSSEEHRYDKGKAFGAKMLGISSFYQANYDRSLEYYREAQEIYRDLKDTLEVGKAYYNIAMTYNNKGDWDNTLKNAMEAIRIFDAMGNYIGSGRVYNLMGITASRNKEEAKAAAYFKKFLENAIKANDSLEMATGYNNLGSTYSEMNEADSALSHLYKSIAIYEAIGIKRNLSSAYDNIAVLLDKQGKLDEAIVNLKKAVELAGQEKNKYREAGAVFNLGLMYRKKNDNQKALELTERSAEIAREIGDNYQLAISLKQLALLKSLTGQYRLAYDYLVEADVLQDSIFNVEMAKSNEELKTKYETEKKEQEIVSLSQENLIKSLQLRQRNTWLLIAIAALFLLGLGAWLRIRNRNLRAEAKLQRELAQKQEEATLAILEAEERERSRIAADLHDGVGQLLSAALLNLNQVHKKVEEVKPPLAGSMENAISLVKDSYNEMREISHQMMPNALLKAGLGYSIREFIGKVDNEQLRITLDIVGMNERLEQQTEILLYRCVQEAVNNVIKHAEADKLSIQLVRDTEGVSVSIEDNGKGFDPGSKQHDEGIGLKNMRSRIDLLKGSLDVDSVVGKGTLLVIFIPLGQ